MTPHPEPVDVKAAVERLGRFADDLTSDHPCAIMMPSSVANGRAADLRTALSLIDRLQADNERMVEDLAALDAALEPFARCAQVGKRGGEFVIAKAIYNDPKHVSSPRQSHWHWSDFARARQARQRLQCSGGEKS